MSLRLCRVAGIIPLIHQDLTFKNSSQKNDNFPNLSGKKLKWSRKVNMKLSVLSLYNEADAKVSLFSGQQKLATALEFFQNNRSDSFGVKPPLY